MEKFILTCKWKQNYVYLLFEISFLRIVESLHWEKMVETSTPAPEPETPQTDA